LVLINSRRYEMLVSVCFTCLCNSTHRKLHCIGNFNRYVIGTYQLVNDICACRGNACVRTCKTKTKIEPKLNRQRKRKCQRKTKTKVILKTKNTVAHTAGLIFCCCCRLGCIPHMCPSHRKPLELACVRFLNTERLF